MTIPPFKFKHLGNSDVLRQYIRKTRAASTTKRLQLFACLRHFQIYTIFAPVTVRSAALRLDTL